MEIMSVTNAAILAGALFILVGIFSSLVANRFGAPLLFVFLVVGMLVGEDGPIGYVFDNYELAYLIGSLALAVILFDGGLRTKIGALRGALAPAITLATLGVLITAGLTAIVAFAVIPELSTAEALLFGGIVASTDAAAVFFLLRSGGLRLRPRVGALLEMESGTNDPLALFLAILLTEWVLAEGSAPAADVFTLLLEQGLIGAAVGVAGGFVAVAALNRIDMPDGLHPLFAVSGAVFIYSAAAVMNGSGFLAAYLAGLVLANRPARAYPSIVAFHDAATWLCQIVMFLVLGLLVTPSTLFQYVVPGLAIAVFLAVIARPVAVWLCLSPFGFSRGEKLFTSWVGLRGAVSIFLATIPTLAGVPHAEAYFNVAFFVVLISLLFQGSTITTLARRWGIALRRPAPAVTRFEIDIPGQAEQELVGYPILPDSMILGLTKLPSWARPALVVRDKDILDPSQAGPLQPGDYAYFLAPPRRVFRLDQLFAESADTGRHAGPVFGELAVNGDATMGELSRLYDLGIAREDAEMSVADYFAHYRSDVLKPGQRLPAGRGWLVARHVDNGRLQRAGLQLEEMMGSWLATLARSEGGRLGRQTRKLRVTARNLGRSLKEIYTRRPEAPPFDPRNGSN